MVKASTSSPYKWPWILAIGWMLLVGISLLWNKVLLDEHILEDAKYQAKTIYNLDIVYRRWNAGHGGVYVPITEETPASPYLSHIPERDISTPSGKKLTLLNPAYMTRQVHEMLQSETEGRRGHITSIKPIRPENSPDPWETKSLKSFESGEAEAFSKEFMENGQEYFRYMAPLIVEKSCLKCHAAQGYKLGDIRGGVSVSIPADELTLQLQYKTTALITSHLTLLFFGLVGLFIGGRRQARRQIELMEHEEQLRLAFGTAKQAWFDLDIPTGKVNVSPEYPSLLGYEPEEFKSDFQNWVENIHPDDRDATLKAFKEALTSDEPATTEFRRRTKSGDWVWIQSVGRVVARDEEERPLRLVGVHRDISERKLAEKALQTSKEFTENALNAQLDTFFLFDTVSGKAIQWNDTFKKVSGYNDKEIAEMPAPASYYSSEDLERAAVFLKKILPHGSGSIELELICKDGRKVPTEYQVSTITDKEKDTTYLVSIGRDISERRRIEEALRNSECGLRQAQETAHVGSWTLDLDGNMTSSDELHRILGIASHTMPTSVKQLLKHIHFDDRFALQTWIEASLTGVKPRVLMVRGIMPDGSHRHINAQCNLICDVEGNPIHLAGTFQDITERLHLEEQFHQAQKMEALGTLVGGIAHDFNNILAGMTGNLFLAKQKIKTIPAAMENLDTVEKLSFRAAELIQQLLTFARKDRVDMKILPLIPFLKETLKFLRSSLPENITMHQDIISQPISVKGDATQLHQVMMNLITNARDALKNVKDPCINIKLITINADDPLILSHSKAMPVSHAHLSVEDNGCGIPKEEIEHLFEPFFTTKEVGKGTGLGLAMVFGAIKTHQGFIEAESTLGKGTIFHIYLPLEESEKDAEPVKELVSVTGHGETILLVDDEVDVIDTGEQVLKTLGYTVLTACDGMEAIDVFTANQDKISLVIMDIVMPKAGGVEAANKIKTLAPDVQIIFATGYDVKESLSESFVTDGIIVISKPYKVEKLSQIIRKQLDG